MEIKNIKLVGLDLDGTLLTDEKTVTEKTRKALASAHKKGIHIVPITGRPLFGIPKCVREIEEIEYIICANGAQIVDAKTNKSLYSFTISNEKSRKLISILRSLECIFEPLANGVGYTEQYIYDMYMKQFRGTPLEDYVISSRRIVENVEAIFDDASSRADEFFVNCQNSETRDKLILELDRLGGLQHCNLIDRYIEVTREGCDKGEALEALCRHLDIPVSSTMAFGDGDNDLLFLEKAGIAVAMENALPGVKEKADIIAKSNNDNGVAEILSLI